MQEQHDFRETLYTVDKHGHRHWVYAQTISGFFRKQRFLISSILITLYVMMPWVTINGMQAVHLNIGKRQFIFFGSTFWATDTQFLAVFLLSMAVTLFFFSALFGRIWCGWACPETVFVEFIFRPIEILIEGSPAQRKRLDESPLTLEKVWRKGLKYAIYLVVSWFLASTFLAYFLGREPLFQMMQGSPLDHLTPFIATVVMMGLITFQFGWFREQFCTALCPYARFQSVLLDSNSLLVGYDPKRGEPRGKRRAGKDENLGDCIDCGLCVRVCPTGIDIRNGLQLECIQCAACIDACDSVMVQIGKPLGLVRYSTETALGGGRTHYFRPRTLIYGLILCSLFGVMMFLLDTRSYSEFQVLRGALDKPFMMLPDGRVSNHLHVHISNKDSLDHSYTVKVDNNAVEALAPLQPFPVKAGELGTMPLFVNFDKKVLQKGKANIDVTISDGNSFEKKQLVTILGPDE